MPKIVKGFTLVDLMIVVAILGILALIAIPSFQQYHARAVASSCTGAIQSFSGR